MKKSKMPARREPPVSKVRPATEEDLARLKAEPDPEFMARVKAAEIRATLTPRIRPLGYGPIDIDPGLLR